MGQNAISIIPFRANPNKLQPYMYKLFIFKRVFLQKHMLMNIFRKYSLVLIN